MISYRTMIGRSPPIVKRATPHLTREAIRNANQRKLKSEYAKFYKTKAGKLFVKQFGKSHSNASPHFHNGNGDIEFHDPADLPQSSILDHPMNHIEPEIDSGFSKGGIDFDDLLLIRDTFRQVFRWGLDGDGLVGKGLRCNICIAQMKPDLSQGSLTIDLPLQREFLFLFNKPEALTLTGYHFNRVLEWLRRGDPISARGERVDLLAYTLWPSLINASTLHTLGQMSNKTRQAKDKLANCLRDTFSGLKALAMRNDITRARCKASQLQHYAL
jgi:hypothetical protein